MVKTPGVPLLQLQNIQKKFGSLEILDGVDLDVTAGQRVAILGPSGAGKSTLLHIAGLMEPPTSGEMTFQNQNALKLSESEMAQIRLNSIGFLFQFHYLLPDFNVLENTLIPVRLAGADLKEGEQQARQLLKRLGLDKRLMHRPHQLSGGEQQRAALARALIRKPHLLLCDEPSGNLDSKTAHVMMELLWQEVKERSLALILVTHNEDLASEVDISYHLADGKLKKG